MNGFSYNAMFIHFLISSTNNPWRLDEEIVICFKLGNTRIGLNETNQKIPISL